MHTYVRLFECGAYSNKYDNSRKVYIKMKKLFFPKNVLDQQQQQMSRAFKK